MTEEKSQQVISDLREKVLRDQHTTVGTELGSYDNRLRVIITGYAVIIEVADIAKYCQDNGLIVVASTRGQNPILILDAF